MLALKEHKLYDSVVKAIAGLSKVDTLMATSLS